MLAVVVLVLAFTFVAVRATRALQDPPFPSAGVGLFVGTVSLAFLGGRGARKAWGASATGGADAAHRKRLFRFWAGLGVILVVAVMAVTEYAAVQDRQALINQGRPVKASTILQFPFLDIKARYARVLHSDGDPVVQARLKDPHLLYLGRSSDSVMFVSCGQSLSVPAANLAFETTSGDTPYSSEDSGRFCGSYVPAEPKPTSETRGSAE